MIEAGGDASPRDRAPGGWTVLVTPTSFGENDPGLKAALAASVRRLVYNPTGRPLRADQLCGLVRGVDGYIAGLDEVDASVIAAADRLKVIARYGTGVDRVDLEAATRAGIVVTNTPGANSVAVAELAVGFILALARQIPALNEATRKGEWPRSTGLGLRGKVVGIIGLGAVGREVARRLKGFECAVLATDPFVTSEAAAEWGVRLVPPEELLARAQFVSLHLPSLPSTRNMVDHEFLSRMRKGAFLVNTARGDLVDEAALLDALGQGHVAGAALDCFSKEPPDRDNPLLAHPRVILTPHAGAHTDEAMNLMAAMAMDDCLTVLAGGRPGHVVNPEVYGVKVRDE